MRIAVFGANGGTGRRLVGRALTAGDEVVAVTRRPDAFPIRHERLTIVGGDATDETVADRAITGADAVLSSIGIPFSKDPISVYSGSAERMIAAMRAHGVRRLAVTSSTAVEPHAPTEGWLFEKVLQPWVVNGIGRTTYDDMRRMEEIIASSDLDWTIARASGLFAANEPTAYRVTAEHAPGRATSRADLADFLWRQTVDHRWIHERPEVHTDDRVPSIVSIIWNEGIKPAARRPEPRAD
jgi:uncharacterized protein YbjT (DUF2867 family)